jgi:hypothetical protein
VAVKKQSYINKKFANAIDCDANRNEYDYSDATSIWEKKKNGIYLIEFNRYLRS